MRKRARARVSLTLAGAALAVVLAAGASARGGDLTVEGFALARGIGVEGPTSWLAGGFGRLAESGRGGLHSTGGAEWVARGEMAVALDWRPSPLWTVHAQGLARAEPAHAGRARAGVTEAFVQFRPELTPSTSLRVRLGTLFLPTSRENTGTLWTSPYTLTLSALDSWMGEEMRPTALEITLLHKDPGTGDALQATAALFGGADTLGALLAWRGWVMGDRLVTMGESLRLPPLASLAPGGAFGRQRPGTTPIAELDGRPGWMAAARWSHGERVSLQAWALDNDGDRLLHRGQYSWRTRLVSLGGTLALVPRVVVVTDAALGHTGMGPLDDAHVDVDFRTAYVLASLGGPRARLSARYDVFRNVDRDHTAEPDDDDGHAWTLAALWSPARWLRLGLEGVRLVATRPAAPDPSISARRVQGEVRVRF